VSEAAAASAQSPTTPRVAAVVLNYNGRDVTLDAVASLLRMTYPRFDVFVVDNGSADDSYAAIARSFPQVTQLRTEVNLGPAGGLNLGICGALAAGCDYVLLLNNDIEVEPALLTELVRVAERDASIGCVGPKELYWAERNRIWSAGGILRFRESVTRERGDGELDTGQYDRCEEVAYINGCAMLVRGEVFRRVGLFDPIYAMAVEDADFCTRLKLAGYRCVYVPAAKLWHRVAYNTGVYHPRKTFHTGRSTAIYVRRYATPAQRLRSLVFVAASLPIAFLRELRRGNQAAVYAKLRGFVEGLRVPLTPPPALPRELLGKEARAS
jgi:hypothetical protein